jgi:hypothetical protein
MTQASLARRKTAVLSENHDAYWKHSYRSRPYVEDSDTYADFGPAYAFGLQLFRTRTERVPSDLKCDLTHDWNASRGESSLQWDRAKHAAYDAWERLVHFFEREQ